MFPHGGLCGHILKAMELVLARAGLADNGKRLTPEIIREVVETFAEVSSAPVVVGHTFADYMPAFGWVRSVRANEDYTLLFGEVDLLPPLKDFYAAGYYRKWSVGIYRRPRDRKHYLHHLAFLGAVPPAIKGLSVIKMAEEGEGQVFEFVMREDQTRDERPGSEPFKKHIEKEVEMADIEALKKENEELKARLEELERKLSEAEKERARFSDFKGELERLRAEFAEARAKLKRERLARLREAAEGKLPKEALDRLLVFAEGLPEEPLEFSDGEKKVKRDPLEVLTEIFSALPKPVAEGPLAMGDVKPEDDFDPTEMARKL